MSVDPVRAIADAVLYEGYILWPYRRSALKNQRRFTFGGVYPPAHTARHPDDACTMRTEVLIDARCEPEVEVALRWLHVVQRTAARWRADGLEAVDEVEYAGERHQTWEEATERELTTARLRLTHLRSGHVTPIVVEAGREVEALGDDGALIREWAGLAGELRLEAAPLGPSVWRVSAEIANLTPFAGANRQDALRQTFCSTHTLLRVRGGAFISLADPPPPLAAAAAACRNLGTWPALVGDPDAREQVLSSPIILEDFPRVAPESPGDLFDGGEIDQLLTLSILAMTDEEKAEMAASDPRAREILERTEALTPEELMALHGAIREFGMAR